MIRPNKQILQKLANLMQHNNDIVSWLEQVYNIELERLPYAGENLAVMQGRCQVLGELVKLIKEAPGYFGGKA